VGPVGPESDLDVVVICPGAGDGRHQWLGLNSPRWGMVNTLGGFHIAGRLSRSFMGRRFPPIFGPCSSESREKSKDREPRRSMCSSPRYHVNRLRPRIRTCMKPVLLATRRDTLFSFRRARRLYCQCARVPTPKATKIMELALGAEQHIPFSHPAKRCSRSEERGFITLLFQT
jgi:hypothetical protein